MKKSILSIFSGKKVMGLYVGRNTIDLVVLKGTLKGPRLLKSGWTYIYPEEKSGDDRVVETAGVEKKTKDDYIVEAIQRVFKENRVKPENVVSAISSEEAMVRYFQMPRMPKEERSSAINFEAKRHIPFRMEDVTSDFHVVQKGGASVTMDVIFVAVKKRAIERFIGLLERAGVTPSVIEPAPFSLIRAFSASKQISNKINTVVVNIDAETININILNKGVPYIIRNIPLEEDISSGKSLEPVFEKVLSEIKLSVDFYEKQFPSEAIDKIIIYSPMPLENLEELIGEEFQIPVEAGEPLKGVSIKKELSPGTALGFGLALRGIAESFMDINLYKKQMLVRKHKELFSKMLLAEVSVAVLLLVILKVLCMRMLAPLTSELNRTLSERPKAELAIKRDSIAELERVRKKMETKRFLMENIISKRTYLTSRLADLAKLVPDNIWLRETSFREKPDRRDISKISRRFSIKGYCLIVERAREMDVINNFLKSLKKSSAVNKGMEKADITAIRRTEVDGEKVASFEILFTGR